MKNRKIFALLLAAVLLLLPVSAAVNAAAPVKGVGLGAFSDLFSGGNLDSITELLGGLIPGGDGGGITEILSGLFSGDGSFLLSQEQREQLSDLFSEYLGASDEDRPDMSELISRVREILGSNADPSTIQTIITLLTGAQTTEPATTKQDPTEATTKPGGTEPTTKPNETESTTRQNVPSTTVPPSTTEQPTTIVYVYQGSQSYVVPTAAPTTEPVYSYEYIEPSTVTVPELTTQTVYTTVAVEDYTEPVIEKEGSSVKTIAGIVLLVLSLAAVVVVAVILKKSKV